MTSALFLWALVLGIVAGSLFQKTMTVQEITQDGLKKLGPSVEVLAELEGLDAHKNAVSLRLGVLS